MDEGKMNCDMHNIVIFKGMPREFPSQNAGTSRWRIGKPSNT